MKLESEPGLEWPLPNDGNDKCSPPEELVAEEKAGEDGKCVIEGLELGVGGTSGVALGNDTCWKPGVRMVKLVGFFLPDLCASLRGDTGAEKVDVLSRLAELVGLGRTGALMFRDRFFTFLLPRLDGSDV